MKKFIVLMLVCVLCAWPEDSAFAVIYGRGGYESQGYSESTAWEIDSAEVLAKLRDDVNAGKMNYEFYARLTNDIDLTGYRDWIPIGGAKDADTLLNFNHFKGHFDGCHHTIHVNISVNGSGIDTRHHEIGLFGVIDGGSVKNLNVTGTVSGGASYSRIKYNTDPTLYVGGIACILQNGIIENCTFNGNITSTVRASTQCNSACFAYVGGIVAQAGRFNAGPFNVYIKNCKVGDNLNTTISVNSDIGHSPSVGSLVGTLYLLGESSISSNYVRATISSSGHGKILTEGMYGSFSGGNFGNILANNIEANPSDPPVTLNITTASLPSGKIGSFYNASLTATATGIREGVKWAATSGFFPPGLTLNADGTISGSPAARGTYIFTVTAYLGTKAVWTAAREYTITIYDNQPLVVKNASLSNGTVNKSYAETLKAELTGAELPATWSYTGTLPPGLTLNTNGTISGTPTQAGEFTFTVTAIFDILAGTKTFTVKIKAGGDTELPEAEDDIAPEFKAHQPDLDGIIVVNFYAYMPGISGVNYNNSYVNFKILNDTSYNPTQEYNPSFTAAGKLGTYYGFRCCVTSVQMADPITATLHYGNGLTVEHTYKLTDYLDKYYYASTTPELLRNVVGAMKDYGHYAQIALAEVNGWEIGKDHLETNAANVYTASDIEEARQAVEDYAKSWNVGNSGIKSIGYRLALDADTIIELFIRPNDDYNGNVSAYSRGVIGITDTSANIAVKQSDGRYLVQISGIPAHRLDYTNIIRVVTDKGEFDVKVSALSYVNTILNSEKYNDNMKKAVTSLYKYHKAAKEYWENNNQ